HHFDEVLRRAARAFPKFQRQEQIGRELIGRRGGVGDGNLQGRVDLRDRRDDEKHVILQEAAGAGVAHSALHLAVRGIGVGQQYRVGEQVSLCVIEQRAHQRGDLSRGIVSARSNYRHNSVPSLPGVVHTTVFTSNTTTVYS